jgi:DNA-binding MarR family transcriptional regulator
MLQLLRDGPLSQRELAERIGVEPPTVTRMLQRLELAGIVERRPDKHDARVVRVCLSAHGRALQPPAEEVWNIIEARTISGLSDAEVEQLRALLTRVLDNLRRPDTASARSNPSQAHGA